MHSHLYKDDYDAARDRLTEWWNGGDLGRPAMMLTAPRPEPVEAIAELPLPEGWTTHYSTRDFDYRVNLARRACIHDHFIAEAIPNVSPDLAPNCLALYLGCHGVEGEDTVWCEPVIEDPEQAEFRLDPGNFYWDFTLRLAREQLRLGERRFLTSFPDLIEGLDTLAALRGTQALLFDLIERPEWVRESLVKITERYFTVYDQLYELIKDDRGGSHFWTWAPGRMAKIQCDISAMISPAMYKDFMVPVLETMTPRLDYCIYHWDGPGALPHHDHLLAIERIPMIQWTPGAAAEPVMDRRWWPYYHKTIDAGKKVLLLEYKGVENLRALRDEFGPKFKQFMIGMRAESKREADEIMRMVCV